MARYAHEMDARECTTVEIVKGDCDADTDSTGADSTLGAYVDSPSSRSVIYNYCPEDALSYSHNPYVTADGIICHADNEVLGTTRGDLVKSQTLMIWDWDDTLFPSSWINMQGMRLDDDFQATEMQMHDLGVLAEQVNATIELAKSLGSLVIITNAEEGWVPLSCNKFLAQVKPSIDNVKVVSARTRYETAGVFSPLTWKMKCFEHEIEQHFEGSAGFRNCVSLGDSVHEREAMQRVARELGCGSKTMKLPERPTIEDLCHCHELMRKQLATLCGHSGDVDLSVRLGACATSAAGAVILMS